MQRSGRQVLFSFGRMTTARSLCLALFVALCSSCNSASAGTEARDAGATTTPYVAKRANFRLERASSEARDIADWIVDSGDNRGLPFAIVDKKQARVFVFDPRGNLTGAAAALLGFAVGDDAVPGIGDRPMASIRPEERTTPAGRFVVALDRNTSGKEILWIDYDSAFSMHAVIAGTAADRRTQRLATPSVLDNRISFGCINVPAMFFEQVVHPAFSRSDGIVYVLPETRPAGKLFSAYNVDEHALAQNNGQAAQQPVDAIADAIALRKAAPVR
jgi:hypothetical protein